MERSAKELSNVLAKAAELVKIGGRYQHYKGNYYTVKNLALLESTLEPCVVYQAEYGERSMFIRPLDDWLQVVEHDGVTVKRFTAMDEINATR